MVKGLYALLRGNRERGEEVSMERTNAFLQEQERSKFVIMLVYAGRGGLSSLSHKTPLGRAFMVVLLLVSFQRGVKATQKGEFMAASFLHLIR